MEAISQGKNILYLVPEIALSRQLEDRLYEIFSDRLLTFHSGESAVSRRNSAEIIRNMTPEKGGYVALCTRSGLFLPHHDLGLIIVDEEQDTMVGIPPLCFHAYTKDATSFSVLQLLH